MRKPKKIPIATPRATPRRLNLHNWGFFKAGPIHFTSLFCKIVSFLGRKFLIFFSYTDIFLKFQSTFEYYIDAEQVGRSLHFHVEEGPDS